MKAVFYTKYGTSDVLGIKKVNVPEPKHNEILVKVHATTFNRTDCAIVSGQLILRLFKGLLKPSCSIPGTDFAGIVTQAGKDVTAFKIGDRVFGFDDMGLASQAQYMCIDADKAIAVIPENISYEQAAASLEGVHYAINFINKVTIKPGQKVFINGATGAIGSALVQLVKRHRAYITATCSTNYTHIIKSIGADKTIDYTKEDFTKDHEKYDFVFDTVSNSTFGKCKPLLHKNGIYISSELGPMAQNVFFALFTPLSGGKKVKFPIPVNIKASISDITPLLINGEFKPLLDRKFPMEQIREAYQYAASGQKIGNVIIYMWE